MTEELIHVDPKTLLIANNVRAETHTDAKDFAQSIKTRGVIECITAYRTDNGDLMVLRGQRRTLVASQVGTPTGTVPVRVVEAPADPDRIVDQLTENVHRAEMTRRDVAEAVNQLALLGISPAQIAKRVALPRKQVDTTLTITQNETARDRLATHDLTLEDAALYAEFDGDPDALATLDAALAEGKPLTHTAQALRDSTLERHAARERINQLRADGLPVLDPIDVPHPLWRHRVIGKIKRATREEVTPENAANLPGAVLVVHAYQRDPYDLYDDEDTDDNTDTEPELVVTEEWIITDPEAVDLANSWEMTHLRPTTAAEPTEAEKQAKTEERRRVIANNKAWDSATTVRREWLSTFLARKTAPKGAEQLIAWAMTNPPSWLTSALERGNKTAHELGLLDTTETDPTPKRATMIALGIIVAAWEGNLTRQSWRSPQTTNARMLTHLTEWGYTPSDIEQLMIPTDDDEHPDNDQVDTAA